MKKENLVDIDIAPHHHDKNMDSKLFPQMSEELQKAIQNLIYQLRELGPIQTLLKLRFYPSLLKT